MAVLKSKEASKMSKEDMKEKIAELKIELLKSSARNKAAGKMNTKEIKRAIARILTFNKINQVKKQEEKKE